MQKGYINLLIVLLLLGGLITGVYLVQKRTNFSPLAANIKLSCTCNSADINRDGAVTILDQNMVKSCINKKPSTIINGQSCASADIDKNSKINSVDFNCVNQYLNQQCANPTVTASITPTPTSILTSTPTPGMIDLKSYYPNTKMFKDYYLEGFNYTNPNSPSRAVLWFEPQDAWSYKMYNSGPEDINSRCHYDLLSWWDDNTFRYAKTHHECPDTNGVKKDTIFDPPILFFPRYWNQDSWSYSGSSKTTVQENGITVCTGVNNYTNTILGYEEIAPNTKAIHFRTKQTTSWDNTAGGKCNGWTPTVWQEDYWFYDNLPIDGGGVSKGMKRSEGGNLSGGDRWNIWFDKWQKLP